MYGTEGGVGRGAGRKLGGVKDRTFADINYERVRAWGHVDPFPR